MNDRNSTHPAGTTHVAGIVPDIALDRAVPVPHLDQWLGYWLIEPERGMQKLAALQQMDVAAHLAAMAADDSRRKLKGGYSYELTDDGIAMVELAGTLMKYEASDESSTSTVAMRRTMRTMLGDERVRAAVLIIDSPGGTVAGAYALADDIAALAAAKPTHAYAPDLMASAAYLMGSQTRSISAGRTALVGSIGTVGVVYDTSARAAMLGIKVHVMRGSVGGKPAPLKGAGTPGSEITAEQLARWQSEIDALNEQFLQAVQIGRRMTRPQVEAVADGGVWIAADAVKLGLIDRVESLDAMLARLREELTTRGARSAQPPTANSEIFPPAEAATDAGASAPDAVGREAETAGALAPEKGSDMSQTNPAAPSPTAQEPQAAQPATIAQIKAACPGASSDFVLDCAEKGMTIQAAKDAFIGWQAAQIRQRESELTQAKEQRPAAASTGLAPVRTDAAENSAAGGQDAIEAFNAAVAEQMKRPGFENRKKAITAVCKADQELHKAYLMATNAPGKPQQAIKEKFAAA